MKKRISALSFRIIFFLFFAIAYLVIMGISHYDLVDSQRGRSILLLTTSVFIFFHILYSIIFGEAIIGSVFKKNDTPFFYYLSLCIWAILFFIAVIGGVNLM
jgi:predicted neutral ceramidase superfamily lipid hydrolase